MCAQSKRKAGGMNAASGTVANYQLRGSDDSWRDAYPSGLSS